MELSPIKQSLKTGSEKITYNCIQQKEVTLLDYWQWSTADLVSNVTRGVLAEFIVALSLDMHKDVRTEWDAYDLKYEDCKIEVKSSAYIQSWQQKDFSKILFSIKKTKLWDYRTNKLSELSRRQSDVYVFCLLKHKDQSTINPLNLNQWDFYVISTLKLNEIMPNAKSITLRKLEGIDSKKCSFKKLKQYIHDEAPPGLIQKD